MWGLGAAAVAGRGRGLQVPVPVRSRLVRARAHMRAVGSGPRDGPDLIETRVFDTDNISHRVCDSEADGKGEGEAAGEVDEGEGVATPAIAFNRGGGGTPMLSSTLVYVAACAARLASNAAPSKGIIASNSFSVKPPFSGATKGSREARATSSGTKLVLYGMLVALASSS